MKTTFAYSAIYNITFLLSVVHSQACESGETTQYSPDVAATYASSLESMHWLHDNLQSAVLAQLDAVNRRSKIPPSEMKVVDIACGEGKYARALVDIFGYCVRE